MFELKDTINQGAMESQLLKVILHLTLLQSYVPIGGYFYSLNRVAWYLSSSIIQWVLFPQICAALKKLKNRWLGLIICGVLSLMLVSGYMSYKFPVNDRWVEWFTYVNPIFRCGDFIIGVIIAKFYKEDLLLTKVKNWTFVELTGLLMSIIMGYLYFKESTFFGTTIWIRNTIIYIIPNMIIVYSFAINKGYVSKILTNRLTIYIGKISALLFMFHQIIMRIVDRYFTIQNVQFKFAIISALSIIIVELYKSAVKYVNLSKKGASS